MFDLVGGTALIRLRRIEGDCPGIELYGKAEFRNPGGSVKDRPARLPENVTPKRKRMLKAYGAESGTFVGVGRCLREQVPGVVLASMQPDGPLHGLEGLKHMDTAIVPGIYDRSIPDVELTVETEDAFAMTRRLARDEGLVVGISAGANVVAATRVATAPAVVVTILCDGGERYLPERFWEARS